LGTIGGDFAMVVGSATPLAAPQLGEGEVRIRLRLASA
jgi:hypothetical protein